MAASHPEAPKQDYTTIDTAFVEKTDIYLNSGMGSLAKEIEAVKQGKETTLSAKTGLSHEKTVDKIYDMLNASDSFFHFDSKQYKAVKEGLNKLKKGTATPEERQKLTEDVKTYLTDPDLQIMGLSSFILSALMEAHKEKAYLVTTGYNRNMIRIQRTAPERG